MSRKARFREFFDKEQKEFLKNLWFEYNIEEIRIGHFGIRNELGCDIKIRNEQIGIIVIF